MVAADHLSLAAGAVLSFVALWADLELCMYADRQTDTVTSKGDYG